MSSSSSSSSSTSFVTTANSGVSFRRPINPVLVDNPAKPLPRVKATTTTAPIPSNERRIHPFSFGCATLNGARPLTCNGKCGCARYAYKFAAKRSFDSTEI